MATVVPKRMNPKIEYLPDNTVTESLDHELRGLLTTCFTKPQDVVFRDRWVIRDESNAIVARIGVHEKQVEAEDRTYCIVVGLQRCACILFTEGKAMCE